MSSKNLEWKAKPAIYSSKLKDFERRINCEVPKNTNSAEFIIVKGNFLSHAGRCLRNANHLHFCSNCKFHRSREELIVLSHGSHHFNPPIKIPLFHRIFPPELLAMHLRRAATKNYHRSFTSFFIRVRSF